MISTEVNIVVLTHHSKQSKQKPLLTTCQLVTLLLTLATCLRNRQMAYQHLVRKKRIIWLKNSKLTTQMICQISTLLCIMQNLLEMHLRDPV